MQLNDTARKIAKAMWFNGNSAFTVGNRLGVGENAMLVLFEEFREEESRKAVRLEEEARADKSGLNAQWGKLAEMYQKLGNEIVNTGLFLMRVVPEDVLANELKKGIIGSNLEDYDFEAVAKFIHSNFLLIPLNEGDTNAEEPNSKGQL